MVDLKLWQRLGDMPYTIRVADVTEAVFDELVDEDIKAELIDGVMTVHSPASTRHDYIGHFVRTLMHCAARRKGVGSVLGPDSLVRLRSGRKFAPDLYLVPKNLVRRTLARKQFNGVPELIGEVLSPSNRDHDLEVKRPKYQEAGVKEVWLIDPETEEIQVDRRRGKRYTTTSYNTGRVESKVIPGFWINVAWLWQEELPDELDCLHEILRPDEF